MKYRKKPVVIEAEKLSVTNIDRLEEWCRGSIKGTKLPKDMQVIDIQTNEGEMRASMGDWIIKEPFSSKSGRLFYPCKPDIFEKTYEEI